MDVVAITAGHAFLLHLSVQKGAHDNNFIIDLAIDKMQPLVRYWS